MKLSLVHKPCFHDGATHVFLCADGFPVSYARIIVSENKVSLCDIETRIGFRNYGYATMLLAELCSHYGVDNVFHDGTYTEDGYHYIAKRLEHPPKFDTVITIEKMNFVHDWDTMTPRFP